MPLLPEERPRVGKKIDRMTSLSARKTEARSHGFADILAGILTLAAIEEEPVPVSKIHSVLHEMKPHESILAGLHFSVTGDICYSKVVDQVIRSLVDWGFMKTVNGESVAIGRIPLFRTYLAGFLSGSQLQAIHSTSLRYHDRLRREIQRPGNR
jgi:hypothetical protein